MSFIAKSLFVIWSCLSVVNAYATVVKFETTMGDFEVNLYDKHAPKTVANFLAYIEAERYKGVIIHRSISNFVVQGGGYVFDDTNTLVPIATFDAVVNEPVLSNVRGTLAMAKTPGLVNSASSQWFFNLANNSDAQKLDTNNGGFTVFGQVTGDGMEIIDAIAKLPTYATSFSTNLDRKSVV